MSLVDSDKSSDQRNQPSLTNLDQIPVRMAHGTLGITLVDDATNVSTRVKLVDGHIEVYDSNNNLKARVGVRPSDTEGTIDMAKPGQAL